MDLRGSKHPTGRIKLTWRSLLGLMYTSLDQSEVATCSFHCCHTTSNAKLKITCENEHVTEECERKIDARMKWLQHGDVQCRGLGQRRGEVFSYLKRASVERETILVVVVALDLEAIVVLAL